MCTVLKHGLTGLYNRKAFLKIVESYSKRTQRTKDSFGLVMCDIDHFKAVNDIYGHPVGDLVIKKISEILLEHIRGSDTVGRYGGEEFILAVMDIEQTALASLLDKLRVEAEKAEFNVSGKIIHVTMSFGATLVTEDLSLDNAIGMADQALYQSKHAGRNCIHFL